MAKPSPTTDIISKLTILTIVLWLLFLTYVGNLFGQLGLGVLLIVAGIWSLARSKDVWNVYVARWKKLPKRQRENSWTRPRRRYFYFNVLFLVPLSIGLGLALIVSAYIYGV